MSNETQDKDYLEKKLKQMPVIMDKQTKALLYQKVEQGMNNPAPKHRWSWVLPTFSGLAVIALLFIIFQNVEKTPFQVNHSSESSKAEMAEIETTESEFSVEENDTTQEQNVDDSDQDEGYGVISQEEITTTMVYYSEYEQEQLFTIAAIDMYNQYAIPITLVDPSSTGNPNDYYNRINSFLTDDRQAEWGIQTFPFESLTFDIAENREDITMAVADNNTFPTESSSSHLFQDMVSIMFQSYNATEIKLEQETQLGAFGERSSISLNKTEQQVYKIYQEENGQPLLVPTETVESNDITVALQEMQQNEAEFNIYSAIPTDATFTVTNTNKHLTVTFTNKSIFGNNQATFAMIEAILMTAKSYQYQEVSIDIPVDLQTIGDYPLHEAIPVPDGINPIVLH